MARLNIGIGAQGLQTLQAVSTGITEMGSAAVAAGRAMSTGARGAQDAAKQFFAMGNAAQTTAASLNSLIAAQTKLANSQNASNSAMAKATAANRGFHDSLRGVSGALGGLWMTYGQVIPLMTAFAATAGVMKTLKLGSEFDGITRSIQFFESQLTTASSQVVPTLAEIKKGILDIRDVPFGPTEMAKGVQEFVKAGIEYKDAMLGIKDASTFALNSGMELGRAVEFAVGAVNAYKGAAEDARGETLTISQVYNMLGRAASDTSTNVLELASAMKYTLPLGLSYGTTLQQTIAFLATMSQYGQKQSKAGTQLAQMMKNLNSIDRPSGPLKKVMQEYQIFFSMIDKNTQKPKQISVALMDLNKAISHLNPAQKNIFQNTLGMTRANAALAIGLKEAATGMKVFNAELANMEQETANAGTSASYLSKWLTMSMESAQTQTKLLKADIERLFVGAYENSSTVSALKEIRSVVNDPATAAALRTLTAEVLRLLTYTAKKITIAVNFIGADPDRIRMVTSAIEGLIKVAAAGFAVKGIEMFVGWVSRLAVELTAATASMTALGVAANVAMSGFVGWQIGKWLAKNFKEARIAGVGMVDVIMSGFISLEYGAKTVWTVFMSAADIAVSAIRAKLAALVELMANTVGSFSLNFDDITGAPTLDRTGPNQTLMSMAEGIRASHDASADAKKALADLDAQYMQAIGTHQQYIGEMYKEAEASNAVYTGVKNVTTANSEMTRMQREAAQATGEQKSAYNAVTEMLQGLADQADKASMSQADLAKAQKESALSALEEKLELAGVARGTEEWNSAIKQATTSLDAIIAAKGKDKGASKEAAAAAKEQSNALAEYSAQLKANRRELEQSVETTTTWAKAMREAADNVHKLYESTATAGMNDEQKFFYERNKQLEEGTETIARYTNLAVDAAEREAKAYADVEEATRQLAEAKRLLAENTAGGYGKDANEISKQEEALKKAAVAAREATAARIQATARVNEAAEAEKNLQIQLYGTVEAYHSWLEAHAKTLEQSDSFWAGMEAGASRMLASYHTLGTLGVKVFDGITGAARTAADETADLIWDMFTGESDKAVDELKKQYDENIKNLEASLKDGTMSEEEFQKERLELTNQYNEEVKAAHKELWEGIGDIMKNLFDNILKEMLSIFIKWIAELAMRWAAAEIFNVSMESWGSSLGKAGDAFLSGSSGSSGYSSAATGIAAASMAYDYYDSLGSVNDGGYSGNFNYDANTGQVGGDTNSFSAMDYGSAGKTAYDVYGNVTRVGAAPAVTGTQALGGAVGVVGGAYGLYSAAQQLANGTADWKTGVQAGLSGYSLYNGYNTVAGYMGSEGLTGLGTAISQGVSEGLATAGQTVSSFFGAGSGATQAAPQMYNAYAGYEGLQAGAEMAAAQTGAQIGAEAAIPAAAQHGAEFAGSASAYGSGASTAGMSGAAVGMGAFAVVSALIMYANSQKLKTYDYQAPTSGMYVPVEYGEDVQSAVRRGGARMGSMTAGAFDAYTMGSGGDDGTAGTYESAQQMLSQTRMMMDGYIDILANDFGDAVAQAGRELDGTVGSTDRFLDAISGYDVSMQQSAAISATATAAAYGQSGAFNQLRSDLESMGLTTMAAETAATALVAGVDGLTNALGSMDAAAASSWSYIDTETGALVEVGNAAATSAGHVAGMTQAIAEFSSTPLEIDVRMNQIGQGGDSFSRSMTAVDHQSYLPGVINSGANLAMVDIGQYHADGGIFPSATLLRSRGGFHVVGESLPEAIIPLHAGPKTLQNMDDKLDALANRPVIVNINGDAAALSRFISVSVDKQVTGQARRGQLDKRTVY